MQAIAFAESLWESDIPKIAIENPRGCLTTMSRLMRETQAIQPYHFNEDASKETCLWLKGLPPLVGTGYFPPRIVQSGPYAGKERWGNQTDSGQNKLAPGESRAADRARTYLGIAEAMAQQWGG